MLTPIGPIETAAEYERALSAIRPYFERAPIDGSPEAAHFDQLAKAIEAYEDVYFPITERGSRPSAKAAFDAFLDGAGDDRPAEGDEID